MTDQRRAPDLNERLLTTLRSDDAVLGELAAVNGIDESDAANAIRLMHETVDPFEPTDADEFDVAVQVGAVGETSQPRNTGRTGTYRIQVNVGGRLDWRKRVDATPGDRAVLALGRVEAAVGAVLERAADTPGAIPEGADTATIPLEDDDDGTLTLTSQYLITDTTIHRSN